MAAFLMLSVRLGVLLGGCILLSSGCAGDCPVKHSSADWEGTDADGNYLECTCVGDTAGGDSGTSGEATCIGGMTPRPGCSAYDLGTVDLSADPVALAYSHSGDEYTYELTTEQRAELRQACGLE